MKRGINAFPSGNMDCVEPEVGMTLRDYFAAAALQGLLAGSPDSDCGVAGYALDAYTFADQMMEARGKSDEI